MGRYSNIFFILPVSLALSPIIGPPLRLSFFFLCISSILSAVIICKIYHVVCLKYSPYPHSHFRTAVAKKGECTHVSSKRISSVECSIYVSQWLPCFSNQRR